METTGKMREDRRFWYLAGALFLGFSCVGACIVGVLLWPAPQRVSEVPPTHTPAPSDTPLEPALPLPTNTLFPTVVIDEPENTAVPPTSLPNPDPIQWSGSPPMGKIAFTCFIEGFDQICLMNADGSGRRQLTSGDATHFYASVTPDGQSILYAARSEELVFEIYEYVLETSEIIQLTNGIGNLFAPDLSPDGTTIIFANSTGGNQSLWLLDRDGSNPRPLTSGPFDDIDPTWSPDGSMIAFASSRKGARQLFVMNADGSNIRQVTDLPDMGGRNSWSPDGTRLTFYQGARGSRNIFVININGSNLRQLTNGGDNLGPSWSPDGEWIAFTSFRDGNNEIYIVHPDGTEPTRLTNSLISDW